MRKYNGFLLLCVHELRKIYIVYIVYGNYQDLHNPNIRKRFWVVINNFKSVKMFKRFITTDYVTCLHICIYVGLCM